MNNSTAIADAIGRATEAGRPALVAYLTGGFPQRERFREHLTAIASAADVVEIGVPFTDPMADGVTIQRASRAALAAGVTLSWILSELEQVKSTVQAPLIIMSYLNPLLAYGMDRLPAAAAKAGVAGFIVPDLPYEESAELRIALKAQNIALIQMVTPVTPPERLRMLCKGSEGFIYAVTATGITGSNVGASDQVTAYLDRVRAASPIPVCAGFGIRSREQVERLSAHADGVVVGSALVEVLEKNEDPVAFLRLLSPAGGAA
jgi:tryptophan synthase alpha chain